MVFLGIIAGKDKKDMRYPKRDFPVTAGIEAFAEPIEYIRYRVEFSTLGKMIEEGEI